MNSNQECYLCYTVESFQAFFGVTEMHNILSYMYMYACFC